MLVVGLMSGTSLDGIDASLVKINGFGMTTKIEVIESISVLYEEKMREELLLAMNKETSNVEQFCSLNYKLGYIFAEAVKTVCKKANVSLKQIDLIGSHGQTLYHIPQAVSPLVKSTLQIGDPCILAYETDTMVISNFRAMDIAAGGEGAPLIPYIDWLLFKNPSRGRILQNIGGIGNCTVINVDCQKEDIIAFDTGPGNMIIDGLCRKLKDVPYDHGGRIAGHGTVHKELVSKWMQHRFFDAKPPKSTGREDFGSNYTRQLIENYCDLSSEDLIATATYFTAYSIVYAYKKFVFPKFQIDEVVISGGGGNNTTLISMIQSLLPDKHVIASNEIGINIDEKEAVGFAVLANESVHQQKSNVPSATGAKKPVILGQISLPPNGDHKDILNRASINIKN